MSKWGERVAPESSLSTRLSLGYVVHKDGDRLTQESSRSGRGVGLREVGRVVIKFSSDFTPMYTKLEVR